MLTDTLSINALLDLIYKNEITSEQLETYLSINSSNTEIGITNEKYIFYSLGDIKRQLTNSYQIKRFILELPSMVEMKNHITYIAKITWCDDGIERNTIRYIGISPIINYISILLVAGFGVWIGNKLF